MARPIVVLFLSNSQAEALRHLSRKSSFVPRNWEVALKSFQTHQAVVVKCYVATARQGNFLISEAWQAG